MPTNMVERSAGYLKPILVYATLLMVGAWCVHNFQKDIRQIDLASLHSGWWVVAASAALSLLNYALRAVRWQHYLRHMGHDVPWRASTLAYMAGFAFTLSPGKIGEMVRARYYTAYKVPLQDVSAAFFAERLMDLIVILLLALFLLTSLPAYQFVMWLGVALIAAVLALLMFMPWSWLQNWIQTHAQVDRSHMKLAHSIATMFLNARGFLSPPMLLWALALGMVAWGAEAVGFKMVGDVIHPSAPLAWGSAIGIYASATLVGALSFLPGGLGSTEAVMTSLLYQQGYALPEALLLTLVCRVLTLWLAVLLGWVCVWTLRHEK